MLRMPVLRVAAAVMPMLASQRTHLHYIIMIQHITSFGILFAFHLRAILEVLAVLYGRAGLDGRGPVPKEEPWTPCPCQPRT
jgi:hypothetical protein